MSDAQSRPQTEDTVAGRPHPSLWSRGLSGLSGLTYLAGFVAATVCAAAALEAMRIDNALVLGAIFATILAVVAIAIHESGHLLGGRYAGLQPVRGRMFDYEFHCRRSGWRWRRRRNHREPVAFVQAYPKDIHTMRRGYLWMIASGPAANASVAVVALAGVAFSATVVGRLLWAALLSIHLAYFVANTLPFIGMRGFSSDGMLFLKWWRGDALDAAGRAHLQLIALSMRGARASELPQDLIDCIARAPEPASATADWIALVVARDVGDWGRVRDIGDALLAKIDAMPSQMRDTNREWRTHIEIEVKFAVSVLERHPAAIDGLDPPRDVLWASPGTLDRLDALRAALAGEAATCRAALARMCTHAEDCVDRSAVPHAERLRRQIEAILERRPASAPVSG